MELSAPPRGLLSLRHLCRPLAVAAPSPLLLLHSPCPVPTDLLLSSRSFELKPGFRNSGACPLRGKVSDEVTSTSDLVDDDTTKKAEGPSLQVNSNSGWKDNLDGSEGVDESADSPLSKLKIKVHLRSKVSDEVTSTSDLVDDDTTKKAEGPSLHVNSNSGWKDNLDGSEGVDESADSPLSKLKIKMDAEESYPILFLGAGSLVALWISSAVISILDSVPVVPQVLEVIGLGFTVWFTSRYLIFKENRDEFFSKLQDTKDKILGHSDE